MQWAGIVPSVITYTCLLDAHCQGGQIAKAEGVLDAMALARVPPDAYTYNCLIDGYRRAGDMDAALAVLERMSAAGVDLDCACYSTLIDTFHIAGRAAEVDKLYARMLLDGIVAHWSSQWQGYMDLHEHSVGMAEAAVRLVLQNMRTAYRGTLETAAQQRNSQHVHDPRRDLVIITGHATNREGKDGSKLQPALIAQLEQLGLPCSVDKRNIGCLVVRSAALLHFVATA